MDQVEWVESYRLGMSCGKKEGIIFPQLEDGKDGEAEADQWRQGVGNVMAPRLKI